MSKHFLLALPICALMVACGSGEKTGNENAAALPEPKTAEFPKLHFSTNTILENGVLVGMNIDDVRKKHAGETPDSDDDGYLTYRYPLGPEEYDHEYILEYAYETDTKKIWKVHMDITMPDEKSGQALYDDIVANFDAKYGKGKKNTEDPDWDEWNWKADIGGVKTDVIAQRMKDSEGGYILLYFEEPYE